MGADIHAYVEYKEKNSKYWDNLTRNFGSRNYLWFGVIAGVRVPEVQLFPCKGMPHDDLGYYTSSDYWTMIAPEAHPEWADDSENWVSLDQANEWITSKYYDIRVDYRDGTRPVRVSNPDYHSYSWFTTHELSQAIDHYETLTETKYKNSFMVPTIKEWKALLAAMNVFETQDMDTRIIFWFDN